LLYVRGSFWPRSVVYIQLGPVFLPGQYGMTPGSGLPYGQQQPGGMFQMGYAQGMSNPYNMHAPNMGIQGIFANDFTLKFF